MASMLLCQTPREVCSQLQSCSLPVFSLQHQGQCVPQWGLSGSTFISCVWTQSFSLCSSFSVYLNTGLKGATCKNNASLKRYFSKARKSQFAVNTVKYISWILLEWRKWFKSFLCPPSPSLSRGESFRYTVDVAQGVETVSCPQKELVWFPWWGCWSVLGQDTGPQTNE